MRVFTITFLFLTMFIIYSGSAQRKMLDSLLAELPKHVQEDTVRIDLYYNLAYNYLNNQVDSACYYAQKSLALSHKKKFTKGIAGAHYIYGHYHKYKADYIKAIDNFKMALEYNLKTKNPKALSEIYHGLGSVYRLIESYDKALEFYLKALDIVKKENRPQQTARALNGIGLLYVDMHEQDKGLAYLEEAGQIFEQINDHIGVAGCCLNIGLIYHDQKRYLDAIQSFVKSLETFQKDDFKRGEVLVYCNIGQAYFAMKDYNLALTYAEKAMESSIEAGDKKQLLVAYKEMGNAYNELGEYDKAIESYIKVFGALEKSQQLYSPTARSVYNGLSLAYERKGNFQQAYAYQSKYIAVKDSLNKAEAQRKIVRLEFENELNNQEKEKEILKTQQEASLFTKNVLIAGSIMLVLIGLFVVHRQYIIIKKNKELIVKNDEIAKAAQAINEEKLMIAELRESQLKTELSYKAQELTSFTLNLAQRNEFLHEIEKDLEKLAKKLNAQDEQEIKKALKKIKRNYDVEKNWKDFSAFFEKIHGNFFQSLKQQCPDVTINELRLCALIKLNMNIREIASLLGISPSSVRMARYRLRKKLNLENEGNLDDYIITLV